MFRLQQTLIHRFQPTFPDSKQQLSESSTFGAKKILGWQNQEQTQDKPTSPISFT